MVRLHRAIAHYIVLLLMARSSRAITKWVPCHDEVGAAP
jgi:hypothetical protein